jgi:gamma-glutamylcysteine synthetase
MGSIMEALWWRLGIYQAPMATGVLCDGWLVVACLPQVNLDFESEKDMVDKFRIGLALQVSETGWALHSYL